MGATSGLRVCQRYQLRNSFCHVVLSAIGGLNNAVHIIARREAARWRINATS